MIDAFLKGFSLPWFWELVGYAAACLMVMMMGAFVIVACVWAAVREKDNDD